METLTTLVCLFHHETEAFAAVRDLREAGVPEESIRLIGGSSSATALERFELASIGMPDYDYDHLKQGIREGGLVVSVSASGERAAVVEGIFGRHHADFVDEADANPATAPVPPSAVTASKDAFLPFVGNSASEDQRSVYDGDLQRNGRLHG